MLSYDQVIELAKMFVDGDDLGPDKTSCDHTELDDVLRWDYTLLDSPTSKFTASNFDIDSKKYHHSPSSPENETLYYNCMWSGKCSHTEILQTLKPPEFEHAVDLSACIMAPKSFVSMDNETPAQIISLFKEHLEVNSLEGKKNQKQSFMPGSKPNFLIDFSKDTKTLSGFEYMDAEDGVEEKKSYSDSQFSAAPIDYVQTPVDSEVAKTSSGVRTMSPWNSNMLQTKYSVESENSATAMSTKPFVSLSHLVVEDGNIDKRTTMANRKRSHTHTDGTCIFMDETNRIGKRNLHNIKERKRRIGLNNLFEKLKEEIPKLRDKKGVTRVSTLREALYLCQRFNKEEEERITLRKINADLYNRVSVLRVSLSAQSSRGD